MTLAELRAAAAAAAEELRELGRGYNERLAQRRAAATPEARDAIVLWPDDTEARWTAANTRYDQLKAQIEEEERQAAIVARAAEAGEWLQQRSSDPRNRPSLDDPAVGGAGETYGDVGLQNRDETRQYEQRQRDLSLAFHSYLAHGAPVQLTDEHRAACQRLGLNPAAQYLDVRMGATDTVRGIQAALRDVHASQRSATIAQLLEGRALGSHLGTSGGYLTVPATVSRAIEVAMIQFGVMLEVADTMVTETGEDMGWPVVDDTSNEASYTDENPTTSPSDVDPGFESVVWRAHDFQSGFIKVPYRLFRDTFANLEQLIASLIGERFGRKLSGECTTGVAKVRGIIPRAPVGETTAGATAITYADVVDLDTSLDPAHQAGAAYMFHNNILAALRKLVDSQNRPLWISNLAAGVPDTFNGKRYYINQKMASTITSADKTMITGDFSYYKVRRVGMMRLRRLVERFAEFDQTAFIGYMSADGNLLRPNTAAACPVKVMQQA